MAVNRSRDMTAELHQGIVDCSYIQLAPNRGGVHPVEAEKLDWPTYAQAERHRVDPFADLRLRHRQMPTEILTSGTDTTTNRY